MADTNCISVEGVKEQTEQLFGEITTEVDFVLQLLNGMSQELMEGDLYTQAWAVETLVTKIGWIADIGTKLTGGIPAKGDAEHWFMSPAYTGLYSRSKKDIY